jgi:hypothetical protein
MGSMGSRMKIRVFNKKIHFRSFVRVRIAAERRKVSTQRIYQLIESGGIKTIKCRAYNWVWQPIDKSK